MKDPALNVRRVYYTLDEMQKMRAFDESSANGQGACVAEDRL
jgi:hypothetical protein